MKKIVLHIFFVLLPILLFSQTKIKSFYFENDKSVPTPYSQNQLALFKNSFNKGELTILEIYSYTDSVGSSQYNDSLARKRLNYVTTFLGIQSNSSVQLKPYGLVRKYDLKDYKSWRRVDIYYALSQIEQSQDTVRVLNEEKKEIVVDTIVPIEENSLERKQEIDQSIPYILNVEFIEGTAKMDQKSLTEVREFYNYLIENPNVKILIRGHVCCGNNMRISKSRARSVYRELVHLGIDKSRLDYIGMSNTEPLVFPEKTNADRQRNRRVDVKITPIDL